MNTEKARKDFEDWMGDSGLSPRAIERNSKGDYILMQTAHAWEVWKAAHTHYAKSAAPVVLPPHPDTARLQHAVWRLEDLLKDDDPQAWKEARKFLERLKKQQWQEAQPQADALDTERLDWLIEQGRYNGVVYEGLGKSFWMVWLDGYDAHKDEHQIGRYPTAREAIDAAIAAAKEK